MNISLELFEVSVIGLFSLLVLELGEEFLHMVSGWFSDLSELEFLFEVGFGLRFDFFVVVLLGYELEDILLFELLSGSAVVVNSDVDISGFELEGFLVLLFYLLEGFLEDVFGDVNNIRILESFDLLPVDSDDLGRLGFDDLVEYFLLSLHHVIVLELLLEHFLLFHLDDFSGGFVLHFLLEFAVFIQLEVIFLLDSLVDNPGDRVGLGDLSSLAGLLGEVVLGVLDLLGSKLGFDAEDLVDDILRLLSNVDQPVGGVDLLVLVSLDEVDEVSLEINLAVDLGVLVLDEIHDSSTELVLLDEVEDLFDLLELDGDVDLGDHDEHLVEDIVLQDVLVETKSLVSLLVQEFSELEDLLGDSLEVFLVALEEAVDLADLLARGLQVVVDSLELVEHVLLAQNSLVFVENEFFELVLLLEIDSVVLEGVRD